MSRTNLSLADCTSSDCSFLTGVVNDYTITTDVLSKIYFNDDVCVSTASFKSGSLLLNGSSLSGTIPIKGVLDILCSELVQYNLVMQ